MVVLLTFMSVYHSIHESQKVSDSLGLELLRQLWGTMWVLGFEPGSSGRTISVLSYWAISPASPDLHNFLVRCGDAHLDSQVGVGVSLWFWGQCSQHIALQPSQTYRTRPCLKKKKIYIAILTEQNLLCLILMFYVLDVIILCGWWDYF